MFAVFTKLGGLDEALNILKAATGKQPTQHAVRSWRDARRIPGKDAIILAKELEARGIAYTTDDFESDKPKRADAPSDSQDGART